MESTAMSDLVKRGIRLDKDEIVELVSEAVGRVLGGATGARPDLPPDEQKRLEEGGFSFNPGELGPDDPVIRGAIEFAALLASALTVAEAARLLEVNETRVRQRLSGSKRTLYGIKRDREWYLPRFQFTEQGLLPGIGEVIAAIDTETQPVRVYRWFALPNPDLVSEDNSDQTVSPLDWLRAGYEPEVLVRLAQDL